jgi:hypothetical protein
LKQQIQYDDYYVSSSFLQLFSVIKRYCKEEKSGQKRTLKALQSYSYRSQDRFSLNEVEKFGESGQSERKNWRVHEELGTATGASTRSATHASERRLALGVSSERGLKGLEGASGGECIPVSKLVRASST